MLVVQELPSSYPSRPFGAFLSTTLPTHSFDSTFSRPYSPSRARAFSHRSPIFISAGQVLAMARGKFGEHLKRERELREVSLDELSKATRISNRFLQALENEDWGKLPGGVFGHGFVRSIARYLGLSEEALLGEYDLARADNAPAEIGRAH